MWFGCFVFFYNKLKHQEPPLMQILQFQTKLEARKDLK